MWTRLSFAGGFLAALFAVLARRLFGWRTRPSWSVTQEAAVRALRRNGRRLMALAPARARRRIDDLAMTTRAMRAVDCEQAEVGGITGLWFSPPGAPDDAALLYLHGGGYALGSPDSYADLCSRLALASRCRVLCPRYRLAPEHRFPAAVDDVCAALAALPALGIEPARTVVAGDSAGGALAIATLLRARDAGAPLTAAAVLLSPWVDLSARGGSIADNADADWGDQAYLDHWINLYVGEAAAKDPLASPSFADLRDLPPLFVHVGGAELLLDQVTAFAERARAAGCRTQLQVWPDMVHGWQMLDRVFPDGQRVVDEIGQRTAEAIGALSAQQGADGANQNQTS